MRKDKEAKPLIETRVRSYPLDISLLSGIYRLHSNLAITSSSKLWYRRNV